MSEAAVRPVVSFSPNWGKILNGESITLTCNVDPGDQGDQKYYWYNDGQVMYEYGENFTIHQAEWSDTGNYQCQTSTSNISDSLRLDVSNDRVILQMPPSVYEGDNLTLRCHYWPSYEAANTLFYKDQRYIKWSVTDSDLQLGIVNKSTAGNYTCRKILKRYYYGHTRHTGMAEITVRDLFSYPELRVSLDQVTEGDNITLTCVTHLAPLRADTKLQFAFYRNEQKVQGFNESNKYRVNFVHMEDSGNYTCEVKTSTGRVMKISGIRNLEIRDLFSYPELRVSLDEVTEGDNITLTCVTHLAPLRADTKLQFAFYRNEQKVQGFGKSSTHNVNSVHMEDSGNYTCEVKTSTSRVMKISGIRNLEIRDLFSYPELRVSLDEVTEGDDITLTCVTHLAQLRADTKLQFAFYRNEQKVHGFGKYSTYRVNSVHMEDSGNYTCEVKTSTSRVMKISGIRNLEIREKTSTFLDPLLSLAFLLLLLIPVILIFKFRHTLPLPLSKSHQGQPMAGKAFTKAQVRSDKITQGSQHERVKRLCRDEGENESSDASPRNSNLEDDLCYISIAMHSCPNGSSAPTTENYSITYSTVNCAATTQDTVKNPAHPSSSFNIYENFS
ncbi:Fc receptor-like protein 5 [Pelodytes ibericus]